MLQLFLSLLFFFFFCLLVCFCLFVCFYFLFFVVVVVLFCFCFVCFFIFPHFSFQRTTSYLYNYVDTSKMDSGRTTTGTFEDKEELDYIGQGFITVAILF